MNKKILLRLIFGATLLLLAACTQDDVTDENVLPEGQYPLEIASVTMSVESSEQPWSANAPQTRVTESEDGNSSVWKKNDVFYVKFEGYDEVGTYKITEAGTVEAVTPIYWHNTTQSGKVTAWYTSPSAITDGTVDLSDQSNGLTYVLQAEANATYGGSPISLNFTHQLSKVRVYLRGTAYEGNATSVTINNCATACPIDNGVPATSTGSIAMHQTTVDKQSYWEANVLPGTLNKDNAFTVTIGGIGHTISLNNDLTADAAKLHTVTLKLHKYGTQEIDLSTQDYTISSDGMYFFTGQGTHSIKVTGGSPQIYLEGANISVSSGNGIDISSGNPTIHVQGNNNITATNGAGIYIAQNNTVTITSDSRENKLTTYGGNGGNGIGGYTINGSTSISSGNITVRNVTIYAYGSDYNGAIYAPGIGGAGSADCSTITIDNAVVHAFGTGKDIIGAAAIGGGINGNTKGSYSTITINNSTVNVRRGNKSSDYIGHSGSRDNPATATYGIDATTVGEECYLNCYN